MPVSIGSTRCTGAGPAPFFACVRCALAVLFVIGGSLAPVVGTVCLGRRDSHADQGAVATQFSSSTGAGTSPDGIWNVYFGRLRLGRLNERHMRIEDHYGRLYRRHV